MRIFSFVFFSSRRKKARGSKQGSAAQRILPGRSFFDHETLQNSSNDASGLQASGQ